MASNRVDGVDPGRSAKSRCERLVGFSHVFKGRRNLEPFGGETSPAHTVAQGLTSGWVGYAATRVGEINYLRNKLGLSMVRAPDVVSSNLLIMESMVRESETHQRKLIQNALLQKIIKKEKARILTNILKDQVDKIARRSSVPLTVAKYYQLAFLAELRREVKLAEKAAFAVGHSKNTLNTKKRNIDKYKEHDEKLLTAAGKRLQPEKNSSTTSKRSTNYKTTLSIGSPVRVSASDPFRTVRFNSITGLIEIQQDPSEEPVTKDREKADPNAEEPVDPSEQSPE